MRFDPVDPPRRFGVGKSGGSIAHVGDLELAADELVTLRTASCTEFDVARKSWGYYATPSLNGRLAENGLRAALCLGVPRDDQERARMYVLLVERGKEDDLAAYMEPEGMELVCWLDTDDAVEEAARRLRGLGTRT